MVLLLKITFNIYKTFDKNALRVIVGVSRSLLKHTILFIILKII